MTTIRTTCPRCGEVDMGPEDILLSVLGGRTEGTYSFVCPVCDGSVEKRADRKIVALLVSAGVDLAEQEAQQAELDYSFHEPQAAAPERRDAEAPAFTVDDVIRFHFLLEDDEYVREMLSGA